MVLLLVSACFAFLDRSHATPRHATERQVLTQLALDTQMSGWVLHTNWLAAHIPVCDWELVGCDADGYVKLLTLDFNGLNGTLPASLGDLRGLQDLDLEFNLLSGPLPSSISSLPALVQLGLGGNLFSGRFPEEMCDSVLARISAAGNGTKKPCDLSGNNFECPLPCPNLTVGICNAHCS